MALPALTAVQVDFSGGQITEKAARRDDIKLQRSGLKRSINTRALATGALAQRFGRSVYNLDTGRTEIIRLSDELIFEFLFGEGALRIRDQDGTIVNDFDGMPWSVDTMSEIGMAVAERDVFLTFRNNRPKHLSISLNDVFDYSIATIVSDMDDNFDFPDVEGTSTGSRASDGTSHTINLPTSIQPGELLVIFFRTSNTSVSHSTPTGWTLLDTRSDNGTTSIYYKTATGGDTAPVITTSGSRRSAWNCYRISAWADIKAAFAGSNTENPPALSPSWGSANNLWLTAVTFRRAENDITAPTNFTNRISAMSNGTTSTSSNNATTASARRSSAASSMNPDSWAADQAMEQAHSATIAVEPSSTAAVETVIDGITNKAASQCIQKASATAALIYFDITSNPQAVGGATVYGSNDAGFVSSANPNVTITLYGKNGSAPTLGSRGTSLGSNGATADTANESAGRAITSSDATTEYDYLAIVIEHDGSANTINCAQVVLQQPAAVDNNWEINPFTFAETPEGAKRQPYVRYARKGIELLPSGRTGSITLTFSEPVLSDDHVGVSFRYHEREIIITGVTSALVGTGNVIETLPQTVRVTFTAATARDSFRLGEVIIGATSGAEGLIVAFNSTDKLDVIVYKGGNFVDMEICASPSGQGTVTGTPSTQTTAASPVWDEAAMSDYRGWPRSVTYDRSRLTFCDFPQSPRAIAWSAIGAPTDFYVGADAADAFFEFAPGAGRVLHVVGGNDQFVISDLGCLYIPISEANPLAPGSVSFRPIAAIGGGSVRPVAMHEGVVYTVANRKSLIGIVPTGQTAFPYRTAAISEFHADLFTGIRALAAMSGGGSQAEQYLWCAQDDGTALVGKFDSSNEWVGFVPVTGGGDIRWIAALGGEVRFNTQYQDSSDYDWAMETLDEDMFIDGAVFVNAATPALRPDPDDPLLGRLWFYAGLEVDLMDGEEFLGTREVDEDGFIEEAVDDDFSGADVVAGFKFTVEAQPYLPNVPEGEERGQRVRRRRVKRAAVHVQDATAFTFMGRNFGGTTAVSGVFRGPGTGRTFEPSVVLRKTDPGPITITEIDAEVTV